MSTRLLAGLLTSIAACHLDVRGLGDAGVATDAPVDLDAGLVEADARDADADAGPTPCSRCDGPCGGDYVCLHLVGSDRSYCLLDCTSAPCPAGQVCGTVVVGWAPAGGRVCIVENTAGCEPVAPGP